LYPTANVVVSGITVPTAGDCVCPTADGGGGWKADKIIDSNIDPNGSFTLASLNCGWRSVVRDSSYISNYKQAEGDSEGDACARLGLTTPQTSGVFVDVLKTSLTTWRVYIATTSGNPNWLLFYGTATVDSGDCTTPFIVTSSISQCDANPFGGFPFYNVYGGGGTVSVTPVSP